MTRIFVEVLLLVASALATGFLVFIADVIQKVMNDLDEGTFYRFLTLLDKRAIRSPYAVGISTITFVGMVPYWIIYGFDNWWFSAGLILYTIASIISKSFNLPIYKRIFALKSTDTAQLGEERRKLQSANLLRASVQFASIILMVLGFL